VTASQWLRNRLIRAAGSQTETQAVRLLTDFTVRHLPNVIRLTQIEITVYFCLYIQLLVREVVRGGDLLTMRAGETSVLDKVGSRTDDALQRLLLRFIEAASQGTPTLALIRLFCEQTRSFFQVDGTFFWHSTSPNKWVGAGGDALGLTASESALAMEAIRRRRTLFAGDPVLDRNLLDARFNVRSLMASPLVVANEVVGALIFLRVSERNYFNDDLAAKATILVGQLGGLLEARRFTPGLEERQLGPQTSKLASLALSTVPESSWVAQADLHLSQETDRRAESLASLALELNSELRLVECARTFARRTADLLHAKAAVFAIHRGTTLETLILHGTPDPQPHGLARRLEHALADALAQHPAQIVSGRASEIIGSELSSLLAWNDCALVRLIGSSGEVVGVLCLANRGPFLQPEDTQLLQAIARFASVALENARLFTRMEQANRHWIEIFDAITDFIVAHDQSHHILRVNRPLAEFIGVEPHELIGVNMGALLAVGNDAPLQSCPFCRSTADTGTDEFVLPVLDRTYLVSTSRVHGANSEGLQTIHVLKDITDRREAERRYRELFDNIQEGVFFSTPDGRFVEVNDALVRILGYRSREELLKVDVRSQVCTSPQQYQELAAQMQQHGAVRNHEETLCRQDGSHVQVLINAFAVRDAQQRMVQYRGVMLDISGLKTFQSELQRERDFSGKILNNTQSLILVADTAGLVSYANRRWYEMGYPQNELLSRPLEELIIPARRQALNEAFASTLAGQQVDNLEVRIVHGEGRVGHFSMNLSPMRDEQGNVTSIVVVMSDVTDAATLQAKLLHTEKMDAVGQLVSGVAHEVNNPLTAILGFADLLMENPEVPENARKDLHVILEQAQRTKQIVQNLLSFARQMPPQRKPVQLNTILSRTVQLRAYDLHSRGAQVVEQFDPDLPQAVGDAHQLQQVFLNILNNAYDAVRDTGRPARIEIRTASRGDFVEISFRDNGYGISFPERVFDPFFTTKEIGKGTGLGLSICYGIVHEHGGEIFCHNNEDGEGATFIVRLPAGSETASGGNAAGGGSV